MDRGVSSNRVLVVLPDETAETDACHTPVVEALRRRIDGDVLVRRGTTAVEYVRELGPILDCTVSLCDDDELVALLGDGDDSPPVLVYGETDIETVGDVVAGNTGLDELADRVSRRVSDDRTQSGLTEANARLTALSRHASAITGCETVAEVCDRTLEAAVDALAFGYCTVGLVEGDSIVPRASTLPPEERHVCPVDRGIAGRTYRTGETQLVGERDPDASAAFADERQSVVSVPLGSHGVIQVVSDASNAFDERDAEFLEILADYTTEALARIDREAMLRRERDRLHAFFDSLPVAAVYVEVNDADGDVRCETNRAYERAFGGDLTRSGASLSEVFPTTTERDLFADRLRSEGPVTTTVERRTASDDAKTHKLTVVPVPRSGPDGAAYGIYTRHSSAPSVG